jgi:hypothetical protein
VDDVGELIAQRSQERFPWGVGTLLAVLLHGSIVGALIYSAMIHPVHFVMPRTVAVHLLPAGSLKGGEAPAPAPAPPPEKNKILKPAPEDVPPPPSEKAIVVPSKEKEKKTAATSRPPAERSKAPDVSLPERVSAAALEARSGRAATSESPGPPSTPTSSSPITSSACSWRSE